MNKRDLSRNPITTSEVIDYLKQAVDLEEALESGGFSIADAQIAKTALAVVRMAVIIIKNDPHTLSAQSLRSAFNSQNNLVKETA